jgi:hypothetical protein
METIHKSVKDGQTTWSIIIKNNKYHFKGSLNRCNCGWTGCEKLRFAYAEVADLYSRYQFKKYGHQLTEYWSDNCNCYHLRTSRHDDALWKGR